MFLPFRRTFLVAAVLTSAWLGLESQRTHADDVVIRKSTETKLGGTITESNRTELILKPRKGDPVVVPANDIALIEWEGTPGEFKLGRTEEGEGRYDSALQRFAKCTADAKAGKDGFRVDLEYYIARALAHSAATNPARRDEAVAKLTAFLKTHANNFRFYDVQQMLGETYLTLQQFDQARTAFESLGEAPWDEAKLSAQINLGRVLVGEKKFDEATHAFDAAIKSAAESDSGKSARFEALLGRARSLMSQNRQAEALESLSEVVDRGPQDDASLQAEAYVLQGHCLQAVNKTKEAVLAYLHVDVLFPKESAEHAEALYNLTRLWKVVQLPDRAVEAQAKLEGLYPNSEWTKKLGAVSSE